MMEYCPKLIDMVRKFTILLDKDSFGGIRTLVEVMWSVYNPSEGSPLFKEW